MSDPRKLAIVGYGKMGRMVEQFAPEYGFMVVATVDDGEPLSVAQGSDVAIEFTSPESALGNIEGLAKLGVPTVTGTTGRRTTAPRHRRPPGPRCRPRRTVTATAVATAATAVVTVTDRRGAQLGSSA